MPKLNCLNHSACLYNTLSVCTTTTTTLLYHLQPIRHESIVSIVLGKSRTFSVRFTDNSAIKLRTFGNQIADISAPHFGPTIADCGHSAIKSRTYQPHISADIRRSIAIFRPPTFGRPLSAAAHFGRRTFRPPHISADAHFSDQIADISAGEFLSKFLGKFLGKFFGKKKLLKHFVRS